jgi:hypothetical protein
MYPTQKCLTKNKCKFLLQIISLRQLNRLASQSGFRKRKPKKLTPYDVLLSFIDLRSRSHFSYSNWAIHLSQWIGQSVSKQAICKRINTSFLVYLKLVLTHVLRKRLTDGTVIQSALFKPFNNVYLHDATHFRLSTHLSEAFPGNFTQGCTRAVAKIQTVFNLTKGIFTYFQITSFADPDIRCVEPVNERLKKGDLIIRDLGYFGFSGFEQIIESKAYLLSRFKQLVIVKDVLTRQPICLWKALKKTTCFDTQVLIGAEHEVKVRMVAKKLPPAVADERRRKAKKDRRNLRMNHSDQYYQLLGYAIYITNVGPQIWSLDQVIQAYQCRWYIETVFKSWKSHLKAGYDIADRYATELSVQIHFHLLLIYVSLIVMPMFVMLNLYAKKQKWKQKISLLKLCAFTQHQILTILTLSHLHPLLQHALYYCSYDKRSDRINSINFILSHN